MPFIHLGVFSGEEFSHSSFYGTHGFGPFASEAFLTLADYIDFGNAILVFFFFFFREVSKALPLCYLRCPDGPSQYYRIIRTRLMQTVSESTENWDSIHLLT